MKLNGWFCHFLEDHVYALPEPPPRKRTKPMQVLCVGMPRSGTESLKGALLKLGYDYTYHGWDILYEEPNYAQTWTRLARKKWFRPEDGDSYISPAEFDTVLGHSVAVTDVSAVFAAELIAAYPEAKVVLNYRRDLSAWHRSTKKTLLSISNNPTSRIGSFLTRKAFWKRHFFIRFMYAGLFRSLDGNTQNAITSNGKWAHEEHFHMIRGLVPKENLLEWAIEDGWEPLCEFLGKPTPNEPFPHVNLGGGWKAHEEKMMKADEQDAERNVLAAVTVVVILAVALSLPMLLRR